MKFALPKNFNGVVIISSEISDGPMNFDLPVGKINIKKFLQKNDITEPLVTATQPHKTKVSIAQNPGRINGADGILTINNFALGVKTADCIPLMLFDKTSGLIGAIHVSRKNLLAGIISVSLKNSLSQLLTTNYELLAFLGPHIREKNYPMKKEAISAIKGNSLGRKFLKKIDDKYHFDVTGAARSELVKIGVKAENIFDSGIDTFSSKKFFSSRRAEPNSPFGVFISVIYKS